MFKKFVLLSLMLPLASSLTAGFESTVFTQDESDPQYPHRLHYKLSGTDNQGNPWEAREVTLEEEDVQFNQGLFANPEIMALFGTGQPRSHEFTEGRMKMWAQRSQNSQPHSAMTVYYQHPSISSKVRIGNAVAGGGDEQGYLKLLMRISRNWEMKAPLWEGKELRLPL